MADGARARRVRVWDGPLRMWHWAFAGCIGGSLGTGLSGDIGLVEWHMRFGYGVLGLLVFRFGWSLWGGLNARWSSFRLSLPRIIGFIQGRETAGPRTVPGTALVLCLFAATLLQATAGLFTSDFIFTDGPLVRHASGATVDLMSAIHHRVFWGILALIGIHLAAHAVYGLRRDPTPLSMFTGRKPVLAVATPHYWLRALMTVAATLALGWFAFSLM